MAKGSITCKCAKCGKSITKEKTCGNRADADNWESWAARQNWTCTECWQAEKIKEREEHDAQVAPVRDAVSADLPALAGSEKQIAWANKIRADVFIALDKIGETFKDEHKQAYRDFRAQLANNHTKASDWIDNRFSFDHISPVFLESGNNSFVSKEYVAFFKAYAATIGDKK